MFKHLSLALLAIIPVGHAARAQPPSGAVTAFDGVYDVETTGDPQNPGKCRHNGPPIITVKDGSFTSGVFISIAGHVFTIGRDGTAAWEGRQLIGNAGDTMLVKSVWRFTGDSFEATNIADWRDYISGLLCIHHLHGIKQR